MKMLNFSCAVAGLLVALALTGCTDTPPPPSSPFASGGLGLTKGQWEQQHTPDAGPSWARGVVYDKGKYSVTFWTNQPPAQTTDSPISLILVRTGNIDALSVKQLALSLLPKDAQLQRSETQDYERWTTYEYLSPSLVSRYPAIGTTTSPWQTLPPGTIKVTYGGGTLASSIMLITASEMGIPPTPQPSEENVPSTSTWVPPALRTVVPPLPVLTGPPLPVPTGPAVPRP